MLTRNRSLLLAATLAIGGLTASGCGSSDGADSAPPSTSSTPVEETSAPATTPTEDPADTKPHKATCKLSGGAGNVTLIENGDTWVATFKGERVAATDTTGFYISVYDAADNGGQMGAQYLNGKMIAYFTAVETDGGQTNLPGKPDVAGDTIVMTFPKSRGGLGKLHVAKWSAAFSLAGKDVGLCPPDYATQPFPPS